MKENSSKKKDEQLRVENELKKIKLSMEYGAGFSPGNENIPPEIESQWLDSIKSFEEAFKNRKTVVIYDKIGRPEYKPAGSIPGHEIKKELDRIQDLLLRNDIQAGSICKIDDRELYRFITEELFYQEIEDIPIKGMVSHFIYEEFYPNHEYDLQQLCEQAVKMIFDNEEEYYFKYIPFTVLVETKEGIIDSGRLIEKISRFRDVHDTFEVSNFKLLTINIHENTADASFYISYLGTLKNGGEKKLYSGKASFGFKKKYDLWYLCKINIPGVL